MAIGAEHDRRAQAGAPGECCDPGQQMQQLEHVRGGEDVIADPDRIEAQLLGVYHEGAHRLDIGRVDSGNADAGLESAHTSPPFVVLTVGLVVSRVLRSSSGVVPATDWKLPGRRPALPETRRGTRRPRDVFTGLRRARRLDHADLQHRGKIIADGPTLGPRLLLIG
jgi:hypothetical protein